MNEFSPLPYSAELPDVGPLSEKETNPKDAMGMKKGPISTVSSMVLAEMGLGMAEGGLKYGRHNYRVSGIRASVYFDACFRHLNKWWEGEDIDADSGLNHITKALCSLSVLRDAMLSDMWTDDRPPSTCPEGFWEGIDASMLALIKKYPKSVPAYVKGDEKVREQKTGPSNEPLPR